MSFKTNLLKKINIDQTAEKVASSIGPVGSLKKIDKDAMRELLEFSEYTYEKKRDLDLFHKDRPDGGKRILVLDNDLPVYHTEIEDVVIRKSPVLKEMISIRNAIRILNDSDVVVSRKEGSLAAIYTECIDRLDLSFDETDLSEIERSGIEALNVSDTDGVFESLTLFSEILGFVKPPKPFVFPGLTILGSFIKRADGTRLYGPIVLYNSHENEIKLIEDPINLAEREKIEQFHKKALGREKCDMQGEDVFAYLKNQSLKVKSIKSNDKNFRSRT